MPDDIFDDEPFVDTDDLTPEDEDNDTSDKDDEAEEKEEDTNKSSDDDEDENSSDEDESNKDKALDKKDKKEDKEDDKEDDPFADHRYTRPSYKKIVQDFPELFKKYPQLKTAFFRENKFTEHFPRLEDAALAAQKADMYDTAASAILSGDAKDFFTLLDKSDNGEVIKSFASTIIPTLHSYDKEMFNEYVVEPITTRLINALARDGKRYNNEDLTGAAKILSAYLYESEEIPQVKNPKPIEAKKDESKDQYWQQRARDFDQDTKLTGYQQAFSLVKDQITDLAKSAGLEGKKANLFAEEVFGDIDEILAKDSRYQSQLASLYKDAQRKGFSRQHSQRIINAYLTRVKAVLPAVKAKHAKELKVSSNTKELPKRPTGSKQPSENTKFDASKVDWSKTTDADWINRDKYPERVKYKS